MDKITTSLHNDRFPTLWDGVMLLVLYFAASLIGSLLMGGVFPAGVDPATLPQADPEKWGWVVLWSYLVQFGLFILLVLLYRHWRGARGVLARFSVAGLNPLYLLWGLGMMLSISVISEPLLEWIKFDAMPVPDPGRGLGALLATVVAAPLLEEFVCRGVILESIRMRWGIWAAWLFSSLFFGLIHVHPVMVVNAFLLGLLFAYLSLQTKSIWPGVLLHLFNNMVALMMIWTQFPGEAFDGRPLAEISLRELLPSRGLYLLIYGVALLFFLFSAWQVGRKMARLRSLERKKERSQEIKSEQDALNFGKKA